MTQQQEHTLTDDFHTQNQFLQDLIDKYSTSSTKTVYLNEQMESLANINYWMFWIFMFVGIIFSIFVFISPKMNNFILTYLSPKNNKLASMIIKCIIVLLVVLYPWYIYPTEKFMLVWLVYIKDMIMGNPYVEPDF
jgi:uncharacterized membrane protein